MRRLRHGLARLLTPVQIHQERDEQIPVPAVSAARWLERLVIRTDGRSWFVPVSDIEWVEAADYNIRVHTSQQTYTTRESLTRLAGRLDPRRFVRVHRSSIVNLDRVREVQPDVNGAYVLVLQDGTQIRLSRSMRHALEEALGQTL